MFKELENSKLFPKDEKGAMLGIIRKCRLSMFSKGMSVMTQGELGLEMYFIIEGTVEIINKDGVLLKELSEHSFFGEMSMLHENPSPRTTSAIAKTNLTLAVLSAEDFRLVSNAYPGLEEKVRKFADTRTFGYEENDKQKFSNKTEISFSYIDKIDARSTKNHVGDIFEDSIVEYDNKTAYLPTSIEATSFKDINKVKFRPLMLRIYNYYPKI